MSSIVKSNKILGLEKLISVGAKVPTFRILPDYEDLDIDYNKVSTLTFGFNYFINEWTRVQVNYLYNVEESSETDIAYYHEFPNDMFLVQVQVRF